MTPTQLIRFYKSQAAAARALGYTRSTVHLWVRDGKIPKHAQKWIASVSGGKLKESWKK